MERGKASRPTSFYSQASSSSCCSVAGAKVEMRDLMDSFIADVQRIRDSFPQSPADAASPARSDVQAAQSVPGAYAVEPTPLEEYEHKGIWCDSCNHKVYGIRHKCLDCYNFDLCNPCMTTKDIQSTHGDMPHTFEAIYPPKGEPVPAKAPAQTNGSKAPSACLCSVIPRPHGCPICKSPVVAKDEHPERALTYRCDSCQTTITSTRHKCMTCSDFDLCESCYTSGIPILDHSPVHRFMHIEHPVRLITAPAMSSGSGSSICVGDCTHEGSRYECDNCDSLDLCINCLGNLERAVVEHAAFHAMQGWDRPVRFVPYTKDIKPQTPSALPSDPAVHPADCDACQNTIVGTRHKCTVCYDFDLCDSCFVSGAEPRAHKADHEMLHLDRPQRVVTHVVESDNGTPSARPVSVHPTETAAPNAVHNAWCDGCTERIRGVRHKCLDCTDFDFCNACFGRDHYDGAHEFYAIMEPGDVVVRNVPQPSTTTPVSSVRSRGRPEQATTSPSHHQSRPARPSRAIPAGSHSAACDMCSSRIRGVRYKCIICPDYDVCESCFRISEEVHPGHSFAKVYKQGDIVIRRSPQGAFRHHARCDVCQKPILSIRYKCIHPLCPDFDMCERCEALPIPVHPEAHALVKLRTHISDYDGLRNVLSFAADRGQTSQPLPSILSVPTPAVRIPTPRVQIPSPRMPTFAEPMTTTEAFHTAAASPVVPLSTLGCTIVPHTTIVASLPQSPSPEPIRLSPLAVSPPVVLSPQSTLPSPPPIPASLLVQAPTPGKLTDSLAAGSSSAHLDEHKMHHSDMYKPSYEAPPAIAGSVIKEPMPTVSVDEERAARFRELQKSAKLSEFKEGRWSGQESPKPFLSPVRGVTVQEERDPEAPQMALIDAHLVSLPDVPAREPLAIPVPVVVPGPTATPEPIATHESDLPSLLSAYPYKTASSKSPTPVPVSSSVSVSSVQSSPMSPPLALPSSEAVLNASFVEDRSIVDGQVVSGGAEFAKCWRMHNSGTVAWPKGTTISFVGGHNMLIDSGMIHWAVSGDLSAGQDIDVEVEMKAPEEPGRYVSYWRLKTREGEVFGVPVWCDVIVAELERAGSSGSSEVSASSIIVPTRAPGMSVASAFTSSDLSVHSMATTIRTRSVDTADIESLGSTDSDDSAVWAHVSRQTAAAGVRPEAERFEIVYDSEA